MRKTILNLIVAAAVGLFAVIPAQEARAARVRLEIAKIYWEFNFTANDLGVHVFLDGEDWRTLEIVNPRGLPIFQVLGRGPYAQLGMTELFFEGAEPSLNEVPLRALLAKFPEGRYLFSGRTVNDDVIGRVARLTHAIPAAPANVTAALAGSSLVISWDAVTGPPPGFPDRPITIAGYQVIVDTFQVTVPASTLSVTVPPEFVNALAPGVQPFEVLAIEAGGNQTIAESSFVKP